MRIFLKIGKFDIFSRYFFHFHELCDEIKRPSTENELFVLHNFVLVHRRIQVGNSRGNIALSNSSFRQHILLIYLL